MNWSGWWTFTGTTLWGTKSLLEGKQAHAVGVLGLEWGLCFHPMQFYQHLLRSHLLLCTPLPQTALSSHQVRLLDTILETSRSHPGVCHSFSRCAPPTLGVFLSSLDQVLNHVEAYPHQFLAFFLTTLISNLTVWLTYWNENLLFVPSLLIFQINCNFPEWFINFPRFGPNLTAHLYLLPL